MGITSQLWENWNVNVFEIIDFLRPQKSSIEISYILSNRPLLSYKSLFYKKK